MNYLQTINRGEIEAGFFGSTVQYIHFGVYQFKTQFFIPNMANLAITGKSTMIMDIFNDEGAGTPVIARINDTNKKTLTVGEYDVNGTKFGEFYNFLIKGGLFGWGESTPTYVTNTIDKLIINAWN